ncbi:hypothetical protein [Streptomyces sp. WAC06614]|uniref:hypothetical protein n=1 Tax=Streptomyces sp. WAC06614 TaxID=2487416 RepID=UPI0011D05435|nr:hypothetical protein [Streptomyces sp. WAC06614]
MYARPFGSGEGPAPGRTGNAGARLPHEEPLHRGAPAARGRDGHRHKTLEVVLGIGAYTPSAFAHRKTRAA